VALLVLIGQHYGWFGKAAQTAQTNQPGLYNVVGFSDGDTITVDMNGTKETVRFIGVDTPETHDPRKAVQCFGQAAANFTKQLIGTNNVRLEADSLNTNRDRYNRLLRYVYLPNGTLVNSEIIKQGYGFAYTSFPFTKADEFRQLEKDARETGKGLWGSCHPQQNQFGGFTSNDAP
jgi:micrococcal nuclease